MTRTTQNKNISKTVEGPKTTGEKGCVIWLTGLSGSGKSTIATALKEWLITNGHPAYVLDGDDIRQKLNCDLGFSPKDREENMRRTSYVAAVCADCGIVTIVSLISPTGAGRARARQAIGENRFVEVFVNTALEECEKRDPKGLYKQARKGKIADFTAVSSPYEPPKKPDLTLNTKIMSVIECVMVLVGYLETRGFLDPHSAS